MAVRSRRPHVRHLLSGRLGAVPQQRAAQGPGECASEVWMKCDPPGVDAFIHVWDAYVDHGWI